MSSIPDEKSLNVIFERNSVLKDLMVQNRKEDLQGLEIDINRRTLKRELQVIHVQYEGETGSRYNYAILQDAVTKANSKEDMTDKFVNKVQIMMNRFNTDIEKLQKIYEKVMKNIPKCEN